MNRLVCEDCGAVYYSAAAKTLAEQGQACAKCGGRLVFKEGPEPRPVPVSGTDPRPANGDEG